jgi:hypothetical protein
MFASEYREKLASVACSGLALTRLDVTPARRCGLGLISVDALVIDRLGFALIQGSSDCVSRRPPFVLGHT